MRQPFLPYGKPCLSEADVEAVVACLRTDWLTQGPRVKEFETRFADSVGAPHVVAVSSATAALHLALQVAGIGPGDRVVTSPLTFLASANAALYVGATPDFCDVDPETLSIDPRKLEENWKPDTRAVVAVDYAGIPCGIPEIAEVARRHGAVVIEDACHGVGGKFNGPEDQPGPWSLGANPWVDFGTFSLHAVKTLTGGEGGVLCCRDGDHAARAGRLRSHGVERSVDRFTHYPETDPLFEQGPWYYEMQELGYNFRLTDIQCALAQSQLGRVDEFLHRRREIVRIYREGLSGIPNLTLPRPPRPADEPLTSWHLFPVRIDFENVGLTRSEIMKKLRQRGIGTQVHYIPVHLQPYYRKAFGYQPGKCPQAERYYRSALSLPLYPTLSEEDQSRVIDELKGLLSQ